MFRAVFPSIIRISRLYIQQQAFVKQTAVGGRPVTGRPPTGVMIPDAV